jgi:hypothetical protein
MTEFSTRWDVYRDVRGEPVTVPCDEDRPDELTGEQLSAVRHSVSLWREIVAETGSPQTEATLAEDGSTDWQSPGVTKSRLLGRMIHHGQRPHDLPPPLSFAGGWWELIEDGHALLPSFCVRSARGGSMRIRAHLWPVIDNRVEGLLLRLPVATSSSHGCCDRRRSPRLAIGPRLISGGGSSGIMTSATSSHEGSSCRTREVWRYRSPGISVPIGVRSMLPRWRCRAATVKAVSVKLRHTH